MIPEATLQPVNTNQSSFLPLSTKSFSPFTTVREAKKDSSLTYFNHKTTNEQKDVLTQQTSVSDKLKIRYLTKQKVAELLFTIGEKELSDRMKLCSESFVALTCGRHLVQKIPKYSCNSRYCPFCALKRSRRLRDKYLPLMHQFLRSSFKLTPVHLVLTQKHQVETVEASRKRLMKSFKQLCRSKFFQRHFAGGVWSFEATIGSDGLPHAHLHILAFRRCFFDISILRTEWKKVSKGSVNLRLDRITSLESGLVEIVKYISKPIDVWKFDADKMREFMRLKGQRLFGAFGEFAKFCRVQPDAGVQPDAEPGEFTSFCEGQACPICDEPLFEVRMTTMELAEFSQRVKVALHSKYMVLRV